MSFGAYWPSGRTMRRSATLAVIAVLALSASAAAARDPKPAPAEPISARKFVERQLEAAPARPGETSGTEAARMMKLYHERIGKMLEPRQEIAGGRAPR
jgi:hypothetical protein